MMPLSYPVPEVREIPNAPEPHVEWKTALNALRMIALECRAAAEVDVFKACALLSDKREKNQQAHARALVKCLRHAVDHRVVFFRPGTEDVSFDEAWLMRALTSKAAQDDDSFAFLVRSRVLPLYQRQIAFLIAGISEQFSRI